MSKLTIVNIEGAFPAIDRKKIAKPHVMDGRNYLVDLDGPKSAYGWQKPHERFEPSQFMQSFSVGTTIYYFGRPTSELELQISQVNWPAKQVLPIGEFISADLTRPKLNLPWTHALVGTFHYFANRTWGVLRYDFIANNWQDVTATIGLTNVFFITESGGRLCTLSESFVTWSAIDNGMDNVPSLTTGAGAQAISIVGTVEQDSDYLGIQKTSKGFLSFTTKGVLRSELIDSINPFRHLPGETKYTPLTPWCITKLTSTEVIILTRFGLFTSTDGVEFKEFQPLQNEYFKLIEIPPLLSLLNGFISLYYSRARDELYVSFAQNQSISQYTKAWVLYIKRDSWGLMNHVHKGFVFLDVDAIGTNFQQAFIDSTGTLAYLNDASISQSLETVGTLSHYVQQTLQYVPHQIEGVQIMSTNVRMAGFSIDPYPEIARFYTPDFAGGNTLNPLIQFSLNSFIEVGLFRFTDEEANDQLSFVTNVAISCLDIASSTGSIFDDWLNDYPSDIFEDWFAEAESFEDWGEGVVSGSVYLQQIRGSLDGYETFEDQLVTLDEVQIDGKTKFCTCANAGLFESIILNALAVGESYHLKTLELNGMIGGRL